MNQIYLKHKQSGEIINSKEFTNTDRNGPIHVKSFATPESKYMDIEIYHSLDQAIHSNNFYILTDNLFSAEELNIIINAVSQNASNIDVYNKRHIIDKCVHLLNTQLYIK